MASFTHVENFGVHAPRLIRIDAHDPVRVSLETPLKYGPELQLGIMQLEREGSPPPGLRLPQAKLSRKSNQVARGRIRRFESYMPSQPVRLHCVTEDGRTKTARYRVVSRWQRGFQKAWISIEWMNGCLNNSTKDAARALPDTTFGCGNPPSTTAVLPRADLGFTCRRKSLGTDQALRSSGARRLRNH